MNDGILFLACSSAATVDAVYSTASRRCFFYHPRYHDPTLTARNTQEGRKVTKVDVSGVGSVEEMAVAERQCGRGGGLDS
jgi:hypothetical protein